MATSQIPSMEVNNVNPEESLSPECKELLSSLPRDKGWSSAYYYQFQSFWYPPKLMEGVMTVQKHFKARDDDVLLVTMPKSGTTWLKAMTFATVNRSRYAYSQHPMLTNNPHDLVVQLETELFDTNKILHSTNLPSPRLMATHIPYSSLPESVKDSGCRIVYLSRNPGDTFISGWNFANKMRPKPLEPLSLEEAFEMFCKGTFMYGPFWDHALEYWNESLKRPEKVLFLKYEDMKADASAVLKKLADFLGCPFSLEEERKGQMEEIIKLCSFDNLKNLEINKTGKLRIGAVNSLFYRKGEVGDWKNYLTSHMIDMLDKITEQKFHSSGLKFQVD